MDLYLPFSYFTNKKNGIAGAVYLLDNISQIEIEPTPEIFSVNIDEKYVPFLVFKKKREEVYFLCSLSFVKNIFSDLKESEPVRFILVFLPRTGDHDSIELTIGFSTIIEIRGTDIAKAFLQAATKEIISIEKYSVS